MKSNRARHYLESVIAGIALSLLAVMAVQAASADSQTVLLMHGDGPNATTPSADTSLYAHTMTANGNAQLSTAQFKFGPSSMLFDGSGDFYSTGDGTEFEMGSGDFTIDLWVRPTSVTGAAGILGKCETSPGYCSFLLYRNGTAYSFYAATASGSWDICNATSMGTASNNTWTHLAVVRSGSTFTTYQDGTSVATCSSSSILWDNAHPVRIGTQTSSGSEFAGYMDEVRLSKGVARWTSNFTPPTQAYAGGITLTGNVKFIGNLAITGTISKGSGTFVIDHPLDPANKLLYHSFVESPDVKNIYDGIAVLDEKGEATIKLPEYFLALNKDFRYQFFPLDDSDPNVYLKRGADGDGSFTIAGGTPGRRISWQITGIRHDRFIQAYPIRVEVDKNAETPVDRGEYLFEGYEKE